MAAALNGRNREGEKSGCLPFPPYPLTSLHQKRKSRCAPIRVERRYRTPVLSSTRANSGSCATRQPPSRSPREYASCCAPVVRGQHLQLAVHAPFCRDLVAGVAQPRHNTSPCCLRTSVDLGVCLGQRNASAFHRHRDNSVGLKRTPTSRYRKAAGWAWRTRSGCCC
ncbi:hypothetical protein V5799_007944 [Amblyomma americanum]|uniref:Uncharacterized protein n=1 Tax=Amblyomma americanum TaxID=6943 RepID=A0AAQ4FGE3_AMBAM